MDFSRGGMVVGLIPKAGLTLGVFIKKRNKGTASFAQKAAERPTPGLDDDIEIAVSSKLSH